MSTSDLQVKDGQVDAIIGGEAVLPAAGEFFEDIDPSTGRVIARVARCQKEDVERAISAARSALPRLEADACPRPLRPVEQNRGRYSG